MSGPTFLSKLPKPALFALFGAIGGLVGALVLGEPVWYLLRPPPPPVVAVPQPEPQLAVSAAPQVALYPGGKATFGVQIARDGFTGPVAVKFEKLGPGLRAADLLIPESETSGTAEIVATEETAPGARTLGVTARATVEGKTLTASGEKPVQVRVIPLPPVPPRLAVSVSPKIQVYQRGKNTFAVQVARGGFEGEVNITFENLPEGTAAPEIVVPNERSEVTVELVAGANTKPGAHPVTVLARSGPPGGQPLQASAGTTVDVLTPPRIPVDIVFALDISGSMQWAINGTSRGIQTFVDELAKNQFDVRIGLVGFQDTTLDQPLKILTINREKMTNDFAKFREEVGKLRAGRGGAEGESSLDGVAEAAEFPFRAQVTRVIILITDEGPKRPDKRMKSIEDTAALVKQKKIGQLHIVTLPELKKSFEPLWAGAKGSYFDLQALNEGAESFEKLLPDVSKAIANLVADRPVGKPELPALAPPPKLPAAASARPAVTPAKEPEKPILAAREVKSLQSSERSAAGTEWRQVARSGLWTGAITALVCVALLVGQQSYLQGGRPKTGRVLLGFGGGLLVGLAGGAAGQGLFLLSDTDNKVLGAIFRVLAWALLGGCAGAGLSLFVPNLGVRPGLLGGLAGGAAGAGGYLAVSAVTQDAIGRLTGGLALGSGIGLMVALAELAFRKAWLEVRLNEREVVTVNLGPEPVRIGGEPKACTVWARGAAPIALRFFVRNGKVICGDVPNRSEVPVSNGYSRTVGSVTVIVRTGDGPQHASARVPPPTKKASTEDDWDPLPLPAPVPAVRPPLPSVAPEATKSKPAGTETNPRQAPSESPVPTPGARPTVPTKPNITAAPKAGERCPGCGRAIPGETGKRYCMVCDLTF
ncbi:MAG TPA: vWA domain-containing protein [Gemmata sp.]